METSFYPEELPWSTKEQTTLSFLTKEYMNQNLDADWTAIAKSLNTNNRNIRSPMECYIQSNHRDDKKTWTNTEDDILQKTVDEHHESDWESISIEFNKAMNSNCTPWQCFHHYQTVLNKTLFKSGETWTEEEDFILKQSVQFYGDNRNWQHVANTLPGRSSFQCSIRWRRSLICNDNLVEGKWTEADERRLFLAAICCAAPLSSALKMTTQEIYLLKRSLKVSVVDEDYPNLNENDAQNQLNLFISSLNSKHNKMSMSTTTQSSFTWATLARMVPGKDENKCREKWVNYLDPTLNLNPLTDIENEFLMAIIKHCGPGNWSTIAQYFPGRNDIQLLRKWKEITDKADVSSYTQAMKKKRTINNSKLGRVP